MSASLVVGQTNFTSNSANGGGSRSAVGLSAPQWVYTDGQRLFISDFSNNRVLIYNSIPTSNGVAADVVVGQPDFASGTLNQGGSAAANTLRGPNGVMTVGNKLFIADTGNNRVLVYNNIPTSNNASADVVIGQPDFITANSGVTQTKFSAPPNVFYDSVSGKLFITGASRVLIYNSIPTSNGAPADVVVGQTDFTGTATGTTASNFGNGSYDAKVIQGKLVVTDRPNNRVLIWNTIPTVNGAAADVVIGQVDFTHGSINQGGSIGPNTFSLPEGTTTDPSASKLIVSDLTNHRVLIWNKIPTSNNVSADIVLGQADFTHGTANQGGTVNANTINIPVGVFMYGNKLFLNDQSNHRVLMYTNDSTTPGLSISNSPQSADNGLVKLTGNALTMVPFYFIKNVQYMVNGGGFNGATATDGAFNSPNEDFFFTFDPKSNNNTNEGYTVQMKSTTSNGDTADHLFYFQPFVLNKPTDRSFISKALPTFEFSVNKQQTQLKENLQNYRVMVKKSGEDWKNYIDSIPVDYASVKNSVDNLQPSSLNTDGNGTYEDKKIVVVYSNNNSTITVTPKAVNDQGNASSLSFDQGGRLLSNAGYEWKVQAIDKNNHVQETDIRKFVVGASSFSNGSSWFPLQINSITGLGRVYLSTIAPQLVKPKYRIQTASPVFKGIATAGSTVQLDLTNQTCQLKGEGSCLQIFTANTNSASQFTLSTSTNTLKSGNAYQAQFSVEQNDLFNALPPFQITR